MPPETTETTAEREARMKPLREQMQPVANRVIELVDGLPEFDKRIDAARLLHLTAEELMELVS